MSEPGREGEILEHCTIVGYEIEALNTAVLPRVHVTAHHSYAYFCRVPTEDQASAVFSVVHERH